MATQYILFSVSAFALCVVGFIVMTARRYFRRARRHQAGLDQAFRRAMAQNKEMFESE